MRDIFAESTAGQLALQKLAPVAEGFQLYEMGWLGDEIKDWHVMECIGAQFRAAKSGPNKGRFIIMIKGTKRTAYVTREEIKAFEAAKNG